MAKVTNALAVTGFNYQESVIVMPMENICSARVGLATLGGVGIA